MRIHFTLPATVMIVMISCLSCSKTSQEEIVLTPSAPSASELSASLASDGVYELPVASEDVSIHQQALHFELSNIGRDEKTGVLKYRYSPAKGFTGTDEVTLSEVKTVAYEGGGCSNGGGNRSGNVSTISYVRIRFTVK